MGVNPIRRGSSTPLFEGPQSLLLRNSFGVSLPDWDHGRPHAALWSSALCVAGGMEWDLYWSPGLSLGSHPGNGIDYGSVHSRAILLSQLEDVNLNEEVLLQRSGIIVVPHHTTGAPPDGQDSIWPCRIIALMEMVGPYSSYFWNTISFRSSRLSGKIWDFHSKSSVDFQGT